MEEPQVRDVTGSPDRRIARAARRGGRGMTLIEIMVVVAIIGMILAAVVVAVVPALRRNKKETTKIRVQKIQSAAALYYEQNNECPPDVKSLRDYGIGGNEKDAWGHDLQISCTGGNVEVRSAGDDGSFGNDDDVVATSEEEEERR